MRIDFIGIGAQKSGTTWLFEQLRHHPAVHMPKKEPKVFYNDTPMSVLDGAKPGQLTGDISPVYSVAPGTAEKIAAVFPEAKLIMSLRNPVERAWSQYKMAVRLRNIPQDVSFLDAFKDDRQWLRTRGHYADAIERFRGFRLLIVDFNRISTEPISVLRETAEFLAIDPIVDEERARTPFAVSHDRSPIPDPFAEVLAEYYRPHNERLAAMIQWLPDWETRASLPSAAS